MKPAKYSPIDQLNFGEKIELALRRGEYKQKGKPWDEEVEIGRILKGTTSKALRETIDGAFGSTANTT